MMKFLYIICYVPFFSFATLQNWAVAQIEEDLAPHYGKNINEKMIRKLFNEIPEVMLTLGMVHIQVRNNKFKYYYNVLYEALLIRLEVYKSFFEKLTKTHSLPDLDFLMHLHDCLDKSYEHRLGFDQTKIEIDVPIEFFFQNCRECELPIFCFAAKVKHPRYILMPDHEILGNEGYRAPNPVFWEKKRNQMFWAGGTTGGQYNEENWAQYPRAQFVLLAKQYPKKIRAWFSYYPQTTPGVEQLLKEKQLTGPFVSPESQMHYKYLIDIDGNSAGCSRIGWILLSNSLLFKHTSDHMQWYYNALDPWKHFIPIRTDFQNLIEQIDWAIKHDQEAKQIAMEAAIFTRDIFCRNHLQEYIIELLEKYAVNCCAK